LTFFEFCNKEIDVFAKLENYFILSEIELSNEENSIIDRILDHIVKTVIDANSRYIGFSVFSSYTQKITVQLLTRFKKIGLTDRIVLGGRGLSTYVERGALQLLNLSSNESELEFFKILKERGLAKHMIIGDGEDAIVEFLNKGEIEQNQFELKTMSKHWPDYTDYNFNDYIWVHDEPALDITGSSGCVRNCDFCDVRKQFGKYKFLPGRELAEQMIHLQQVYNINAFVLTDSLSNGGLKTFKEFVQYLADYNQSSPTPISWSGQYICRDLTNSRSDIEEYYQLIKLSGAKGITIGAESGSNDVLTAIDKKSSVEALFFELDYFRKYGITCSLLTFCGHWSEKHEDFVAHCKMLIDFIPYVRAGTVSNVSLGSTFKMSSGTPEFENINIKKHSTNPDAWISRNNRGNTLKVRSQRRLIISKLAHAIEMGVVTQDSQFLQAQVESINHSLEDFNQFFSTYTTDTSQFDVIQESDDFVENMINYKKTLDIKLTIQGSACKGNPNISIHLNDICLWHGDADPGLSNFSFAIDQSQIKSTGNIFRIALTNKGNRDTVVDSTGSIIADKNIIIKELFIDNCDLVNDFDFFYSNFYYADDLKSAGIGIWRNTSLNLNFDKPFVKWYSLRSNKNKSNSLIEKSQMQTQALHSVEEYFKIMPEVIKKLVI